MARSPFSFRLPIGLMAVIGFTIGLVATFFVADMLGASPPLLWASLVIFFLLAVYFLERPRTYLLLMFLFYGFFSGFSAFLGGRVIPIHLPLERLYDEIFLAVPLAILVMKAIQRQQPRIGTRFAFFYLFLAILSWRLNNVPSLNAFRVTLSYMKFYILWHFVRCIGPWSLRARKNLALMLIGFALIQFLVNVGLWQRNIVPRLHPDFSVGTIGSAHFVGYFSMFAIFFLGLWLLLMGRQLPRTSLAAGVLVLTLISYNFIFLTDTKHGIFLVPIAGAPLLFHPQIAPSRRALAIAAGVFFLLASALYFTQAGVFTTFGNVRGVINQIRFAGKGATLDVIFKVLPKSLPFWPLGAGPGNYCSSVALFSLRPLAMQYVLPYTPWALTSRTGLSTSFLGGPGSGFYTVLGEFGIINAIVYYGFWIFIIRHLWRESKRVETPPFAAIQQLALVCCLIFFLLANFLFEVFNIHIFVISLAVLVGANWDPIQDEAPAPAAGTAQKRPAS